MTSCLARRYPSAPFRAGHGASTDFTNIPSEAQSTLITLSDAYVAGLFDGEGYVRIARYEPPNGFSIRYQIYLGIGMTHAPVIQALQRTYGGGLHHNKRRKPEHRDTFVWNVTSQNAARLLRQWMPFLIVKREEAEVALELQASIDKWKSKLGYRYWLHPERDEVLAYRETLFHRIRDLKHVHHSL